MTGANSFTPAEALAAVIDYHEQTKHRGPGRFARSLGFLDWDSQPDPFRRFPGADRVELDPRETDERGDSPDYRDLFRPGRVAPRPLDADFLTRLFMNSLALSAWKKHRSSRWSLRVNPSSGNLHPTEGYLLAPALPGVGERPALYHYSPLFHALERRRELSGDLWSALTRGLGEECLLIGLSSIHWREAWKYGERAFRYCQHDVGHAIAAVSLAAAVQGWSTRLLQAPDDDACARLLAIDDQAGHEAEHPDCLLLLSPSRDQAALDLLARRWSPEPALLDSIAALPRAGRPAPLSDHHHPWPIIDRAHRACARAEPSSFDDAPIIATSARSDVDSSDDDDNDDDDRERAPLPAERIIRRRRSAVAMDGRSGMTRDAFYQTLRRVLPGRGRPLDALPWRPAVDLALFVHRVGGLDPGLYMLVRDPARQATLQSLARAEYAWARPPGCPEELPLFALTIADARQAAAFISCTQDIAGDGCFAVAMLAEFAGPLERHGAWFYRNMFWETGVIGQVLYLEAEALGISGTGIGCFFDDRLHDLLGLVGLEHQSLYHFTIGGRVDDDRLQTLAAYAHLSRA